MSLERILVVDDEAAVRHGLKTLLHNEGYDVAVAGDAFEALALFDDAPPALTITDLTMPGMHGLDLLLRIRQRNPQAAVVVMTACCEVDSAVEAMRAGALDYLVKPLDVDRLLGTVNKVLSASRLRRLSEPPPRSTSSCCDRIVGTSEEMQQVFRSIEQVAPSRATVLITGESGTGKEVVAMAIHRGSQRASRPFVAINCAALSESLLESELFGHERGSFTGADKRRRGRIEQADGGTLFLDEIGEISPALQVKLLRVLQERAFERVGGNETVRVDVRIVTATNRNLRELVAAGKFREDLFYRLDVVGLHLPPLRDRRADIPALALHFLKQHAGSNGGHVTRFSDGALEALASFDWPGNVRQLENAIERATVFACGDCIEICHLPPELQAGPRTNEGLPLVPGANMLELERYAILRTMEAVGGSTRKTAALLGMSVRKVQYRLRQYGALPTGKSV
jgi:DNA-binding NtrC family response regulator